MTDIKTDERVDEVVLPDPRPSDPLEALSWLGETEEEVVRGLRERGIKGSRNKVRDCPLARYLQNWWEEGWIGPLDVRGEEGKGIFPTPPQAGAFIHSFDKGRYPDLIADD